MKCVCGHDEERHAKSWASGKAATCCDPECQCRQFREAKEEKKK